jgi:quinol---cytochrome c reductase cytochrome b subunit, bacillus type
MKFPLPAGLRKPAKPGERKNGAPNADGSGDGGVQLTERAKDGSIDLVGWVDERTGASPFLTALLLRKVPKGTNWFYTLGSATLFAFITQAITGVFLAFYYEPSPTGAYDSIFFGAYKYPRELNWVIGVTLLILTLIMGLTGYLLPFDNRSYWATIVAMNITASGPIVGPYLADFLRAGAEFEATTLPRFYAIHMLLVPGAIIALIGAHLYLVVKLGTTAPPWLRAEAKPKSLREERV